MSHPKPLAILAAHGVGLNNNNAGFAVSFPASLVINLHATRLEARE